ncbi:hypothetical protein [Spirosoma liriopis]|nr:hypothetical protein [Spirosoma liriopis]
MDRSGKQQHTRYLLARAGFGATPSKLEEAAHKPLRKVVRQLLR